MQKSTSETSQFRRSESSWKFLEDRKRTQELSESNIFLGTNFNFLELVLIYTDTDE